MGQEPRKTSTNLLGLAARAGLTKARLEAATGLAAAAIAVYTTADAVRLYNRRAGMANQFQNQIVFPSDLVQSNRDFYISFNFQEYRKRSINDSPFLRSEGTVRLPLPSNLKDNLNVSYAAEPLGPAVGAALESAIGTGPSATGEAGLTQGLGRIVGAGASFIEGAAVAAVQRESPQAAAAASENPPAVLVEWVDGNRTMPGFYKIDEKNKIIYLAKSSLTTIDGKSAPVGSRLWGIQNDRIATELSKLNFSINDAGEKVAGEPLYQLIMAGDRKSTTVRLKFIPPTQGGRRRMTKRRRQRKTRRNRRSTRR